MDKEKILKDMRNSIGQKDPIVFFDKMVDVFEYLFGKVDILERDLRKAKQHAALAIEWSPVVASDMLVKEINKLRPMKDTYFAEISALKKAHFENTVTQDYSSFCVFWEETLGWHPFLDYEK